MKNFLEKIFGNHSEKEVKRVQWMVTDINEMEPATQKLTDDELRGKTAEFKKRLEEGETVDDILMEAFAVVREASRRVLGMRHFDVQMIGGIILHQGRIAEMKTGEGKTLVATLPVYLNALEGKGVHVVTVNDYLAKRDSEWMGKIYRFLGLSVGLIVHDLDNEQRRHAYGCDITYGTNNEFGFDYLRDNMVVHKEDMVQRDLHYAIVDEVDSILIDEARTPLIISGMGDKSTDLYKKANTFVSRLKKIVHVQLDDKTNEEDPDADYVIDEKAHTATLTTKGVKKAEAFFGIENLSDPENLTLAHHINQALKAHGLMKVDIDYVVKDGGVIIVDEFTGRMMFGRRYSDGLHQAIEAKEGVKVERESKTLATITFQNYFRMYKKLAGMTGTALTEEQEFRTIYSLDVIVIPTNRPMARIDQADVVYRNEAGKFRAVMEDIIESNKKGQPVLVGTISIEKSEILGEMLRKRGIKHEILNAKYHEKEAEIVAQAGRFGAVTIATNMAGRGTDIVLGGNPEFMAKQEMRKRGVSEELIIECTGHNETKDEAVLEARKLFEELNAHFKEITAVEREKVLTAGGLHIIGTERHESRRIDNQLRGRAGRQGDPGETRFYIGLDDDLMRLFGAEKIEGLIEMLKIEEDQPIEHKMLTGAIENAQKKVEGRNFGIRKTVLQYDDVMNKQREIIYGQRKQVLNGENLKESILKMVEGQVDATLKLYCSDSPHPDDWDFKAMTDYMEASFLLPGSFHVTREDMEDMTRDTLREQLVDIVMTRYQQKEAEFGPELMREVERVVLLRAVDEKWMDHIDNMDQLRDGISLRAFGQKDPVVEYKFESFSMFEEMVASIQEETVKLLMHAQLTHMPQREQVAEPVTAGLAGEEVRQPVVNKGEKVGRNDPCPCGSGKKYKKCHGASEE